MRFRTLHKFYAVPFSLVFAACAVGGEAPSDAAYDVGNNPPLADLDVLFHGAPKADEIPRRYKADHPLPAQNSELRDLMSPVSNQASRGVCSIFSTVGLMEHLYIAEGTLLDPDFSEQYLQWSAKFEVNSFPESSGSNAFYNLKAITDFGIVEEDVWPYEPTQWDTSDDPECDGEDDQPTRCYTNGHPTDEMQAAEKFHLPRSQWLNPRDIKSHIAHEGTGVVVGLTFFYQSWNHRLSELPTSSENWDEGVVLYPNDKDRELSLEERAGHSIVIFGWDDELEVPIVDEDGEQVLDEDGEPVTEKGFYIFKNSWGTNSFGIDHELGPGYGYISQRYVHEYGRVRVAGLPDVEVEEPAEICGNGLDDDGNGAADCDDAACSEEPACQSSGGELAFEGEGVAIPDNDPAGASSVIEIEEPGTIEELAVDVDITHTYRGDLRVTLHRGGETVVLHDRSGFGADDLVETFAVEDFGGADLGGTWKLVVVDLAAIDTGALNGWTLRARVTD